MSGEPATAWSPSDLKQLLTLHAQQGARWHEPGWHSGYNEAILNSKHHNDHLPHSVEAFFTMRGAVQSAQTDLGYGFVIDVLSAYKSFLRAFELRPTQVPLLEFDPHNWKEPFTQVHVEMPEGAPTDAWSGF